MNSMKDALKQKMMEMKDKKHPSVDMKHLGPSEHDMMEDQTHADDDVAGPAPSLRGDNVHEGHIDNEEDVEDLQEKGHGVDAHSEEVHPEGDAMHLEILKGLSDRGHTGRGSMTLQSRAADKAKEKMASIAAHKKSKGY